MRATPFWNFENPHPPLWRQPPRLRTRAARAAPFWKFSNPPSPVTSSPLSHELGRRHFGIPLPCDVIPLTHELGTPSPSPPPYSPSPPRAPWSRTLIAYLLICFFHMEFLNEVNNLSAVHSRASRLINSTNSVRTSKVSGATYRTINDIHFSLEMSDVSSINTENL